MARVIYGSIVSNVSGSIGSATFQKSLYGNTLRNKPRPKTTATPAQLASRSILMQCQYAWRSLTPAQRKSWDQFISFSGQTINRDRNILSTGHSLFIKYNFARLIAGMAVLENVSYVSAPLWPFVTGVVQRIGGTEVDYTADFVSLNIMPTIHLSPLRNASLSYTTAGLRFIPIVQVSVNRALFGPSYANIFGIMPVAGDIIHYKYQFWSVNAPILSAIHTGISIVTYIT